MHLLFQTGEVEEIVQTFNRKNYKVQGDKEKQTNSCFTLYSPGSMTDIKVSSESLFSLYSVRQNVICLITVSII